MKSLVGNRLRLIAIGVVLVVVAVAGFVFFYSQLRSKSKAAPTGTAELSLVAVNNPPMDTDGNIRIGINLDPNGSTTVLYSFDVQFTYDSTKLDYQNTGGVDANVILPQGSLKAKIVQMDANTIRIVGTRTGSPFSTSNKRVADITFKMKTGQDFPLAFNWGPTALQTTTYVKVPLNLSTNSQTSSTSSTGGTGASLSFAIAAPSYEVGNLVLVDIMLNTAGQQIGKTDIKFAYDQSRLTYVSTDINTGIFNGSNGTPSGSGGVVTIHTERNGSTTGNLRVATVRFTAKAVGNASLTFTKPPSAVLKYGTTTNILQTVNNSSVVIMAQGGGGSSSTGGGGGGLGGGNGLPGQHLESNGDILHINSAKIDQAPVRYEQTVKLDKGDYILSGGARVYTALGRGVLITLACGESNCGDGKKLHDLFGQTPRFAISTDFQLQQTIIHISDNQKDKKLFVRIFVEDGSEADFDFVSLTDVWGGEKLTNWHFENIYKASSPRYYPQYWDMDTAGQILSTIDKLQGVDGSLFINSSSRK